MKIVIIDNQDSFTYNLVELFKQLGVTISVIPYSELDNLNIFVSLNNFDKIIISPGPDIPQNYPNLFKMLDYYKSHKHILGVCLGMQLINCYFSGTLKQLDARHGVEELLIIKSDDQIFHNIAYSSKIGLYHSWGVDQLSSDLKLLAECNDQVPMVVKHIHYDIYGVQFHPESFLTIHGKQLMKNWLNIR